MKTCILLILTVQIVLAVEKHNVVHDVAEKVVKVNNIALLKDVVEGNVIKHHLKKEHDEKIKEHDDLNKKIIFKEKQEEKKSKDYFDNIKDKFEAGDKKQGENDVVPIATFSAFSAGECLPGFVKFNGICTKVD